jgi:hypothetical protein
MMTKNVIKAAFSLLSSAIVILPTVASANTWTDQVETQLVRAAVTLNLGGNYKLTHEPLVDRLGNEADDVITVNLRGGVSYALVGVCDEDCSDIDLRLYDEDGNLVTSDTQSDSVPYMTVTPRWSAKFRVKVTMIQCSSSPCYYGVGIFGR